MNVLLLNTVIALGLETLSTFILGVFLLIKGTKSYHRLYALSALSVGWWTLFQTLEIFSIDSAASFIYARIAHVGVFFIPTLFFHFTVNFLEILNRRFLILLAYALSTTITILCFTNLIISKTEQIFYFNNFHTAGTFYLPALIFFIIFFGLTFRLMLKSYLKATEDKRNQLKYLLTSYLLGYFAGGLNFLPVFNIDVPVLPYVSYLGSIWPWFTAYAILRHQLLDINIVIKKTAVYSILVASIGTVYFVLIFLTESLFRGFVGYKSQYWTLGIIVLFSLVFQPLKNLIQSIVDKHFFKNSPTILAQKLERAQDELKRTERLKAVGTLAAGMAHEIKNPLTAIKTFAEYLPEKHNDPAFVEKFHKIVTSEVDRINSTVQQLLDFSKPKPLQIEECNIHSVIDNTLSLLNNDFIKYKIRLVRNHDTTLPKLKIDPNQMQQVFCNLFLNAIDAMKAGGTLSITTRANPLSNIAEITIGDTGKGIAAKDLEHIFDPFYTTKETGTGLGMSIIYGIVKEHQGTIEVKSRENEGTEFNIKLSS